MGTETGLLTLVQWLSPAFPLGSFAYSHGLETVISDGHVTDAGALETWLRDLLQEGSGRSDAVLLAATLNGGDPADLDALGRALAAGPERLEESLAQGRAFLEVTNRLRDSDWPQMLLPVAVGVQARGLGLPTAQVLAVYLQGFVTNLAMAAVRFVPLGQTEGQAVIAALQPVIAETAEALADAGPGALATASVGADIAAMAHEHQEVRIFRT